MPKLQLTIVVNDQGQLGLNGPINDKLLCYGLLEIAKEAVAEHHRKLAAGPTVEAASARDLSRINGGR